MCWNLGRRVRSYTALCARQNAFSMSRQVFVSKCKLCLSEIAKCLCLKSQNVFVSECKCICVRVHCSSWSYTAVRARQNASSTGRQVVARTTFIRSSLVPTHWPDDQNSSQWAMQARWRTEDGNNIESFELYFITLAFNVNLHNWIFA